MSTVKQEKRLQLLLLNLLAASVYFFVLFRLDYFHSIHQTIFSTTDSREYRAMGDWLFGDPHEVCSAIRPFLYPALIKCFSIAAGDWGIWFMQFACWLLSINIVFIAVKKLLNVYLAFIAAAIMLTNVSFIVITLHALTETFTIFLLSLYIYSIADFKDRLEDPRFWIKLIFLSTLLVLFKPIFLLMMGIVPVCAAFNLKKSSLRSSRIAFMFLAAATPLLVQAIIFFSQFGRLGISDIGSMTFKKYYYAKFFADQHAIPYDVARGPSESAMHQVSDSIRHVTGSEMIASIRSNPLLAIKVYKGILGLNLKTTSVLIDPLNKSGFNRWMYSTNLIYYWAHWVMMVLVPVVVIMQGFKKNILTFYVLLASPLLLVICISGISYWQGDRLILPALPLFTVLYFITGFHIVKRTFMGSTRYRPV